MNNQEYFHTTSLSYQLKAAQRKLDSFRSGEVYVKLRADYECTIRERDFTIKELQKERDALSFSRKKITAQGMIVKLTAQVNHNYENSSLPSSKCIGWKKITNNREKTGKKPGAQPGHPHHPRKRMAPEQK